MAYRSRPHVAQLLEQLHPEQPVAVIDNSANSDGLRDLTLSRSNTRYLTGEGKGFSRAANLGVRTSTYDHVVFCNPDTRPTSAVLDALVETLVADPTCGACAALPVDAQGRGQLGAAGFEPTLRRTAAHAFGLYRLFPHSGFVARPVPHRPLEAEWMTGACLAVRRSTFLEIGGFDERYFVYSEDVTLGRALRSRGLRQVLRTDLLVPHAAGGSGAPSIEMNRLKGASMAAYLKRYNPPSRAYAMRVLLAVGYVMRALERVVHNDRDTARVHLAYIAGITTGRASVAGVEVTRT